MCSSYARNGLPLRTPACAATQTRYVVCVRIGEPARKHGADEDILQGVRNGMRRIDMEENLAMLIGPTSDGTLLEFGVLDLDGDDPVVIHAMPRRPRLHPFLG